VSLSDADLVARAVRSLETANTSSWDAADALLELSRRGWSVRRIAEACGKSFSSVAKFIRCARAYAGVSVLTRPPFWDVFATVNGDRPVDQPRPIPPPPEGNFALLLADPPWEYEFCETNNRKVSNHYPVMTLDAIKNLAVPAAPDSVLFLWATAPKLEEALEVMRAWDFSYRSGLVWDK
jgi:hypothetical protein